MQTGLLLDMAAEAAPDRLAVGPRRSALTFHQLRARARAGAAFLAKSPGETIAFIGQNSLSLPLAIFASAYDGRPLAPLNYRLADADLNRLVARTAPSILLVDDEMAARIGPTPDVIPISTSVFANACEHDLGTEPSSRDAEIAALLFTSGTTGQPKAALLRHANLFSYVTSTVEFMGAQSDEAGLVCVPPYHIAGISAVLTAAYAGRRVVYLETFRPEAWISVVDEERITHAMVVPTMLGRILDVLEAHTSRLPSLRTLSYGGGRMPATTIERAMRLLPHVAFVNAYGLTETSSTITLLDADDHRTAISSDNPSERRRLASVGRPLPGVELEIRDGDGVICPSGQPGEVWVRGEQVSGEYVGYRAIQEDGWFRTNDRGWLDDDGYLFVDGRLDDVIVRGGENISPGEIEDVLRCHPAVADVAVFGVPDNEWGEKIVAAVAARAPVAIEDLQQWVGAKLRSTKAPANVVFRDELPYNETGKLLRRVLREDFIVRASG